MSVELSPDAAQALGGALGHLLLAGAAALRTRSPQTDALAEALEQTVRRARSAGVGESPFVMIVTGSAEPRAVRPTLAPRGARTTGARRPLLTPLEREIVARVSRGQTDGQIAAELFISRRTVQNHLHRIREKTGLLTRADLIRWGSSMDSRGT